MRQEIKSQTNSSNVVVPCDAVYDRRRSSVDGNEGNGTASARREERANRIDCGGGDENVEKSEVGESGG